MHNILEAVTGRQSLGLPETIFLHGDLDETASETLAALSKRRAQQALGMSALRLEVTSSGFAERGGEVVNARFAGRQVRIQERDDNYGGIARYNVSEGNKFLGWFSSDDVSAHDGKRQTVEFLGHVGGAFLNHQRLEREEYLAQQARNRAEAKQRRAGIAP